MVKVPPRHPCTPTPVFTRRSPLILLAPVLLVFLSTVSARGGNTPPLQSHPGLAHHSWIPKLAQVAPLLPPTAHGNQISINNKVFPVPWRQHQQWIGIADTGLMATLGINLLSTNDPSRQPVQWFSEPSQEPLSLPTWLSAQHRYLDISQLVQRFGWQVSTQGQTLQITLPPVRVKTIRQGRQSWGNRLVIDLDQPAPWQMQQQRGEFLITVDAPLDPASLPNFVPQPGDHLTALTVETTATQTRLRVRTAQGIPPRISTLPTPHRLVVDMGFLGTGDRNILWSPGLRWQQQQVQTPEGVFGVTTLTLSLNHQGIHLKPVLPNPGQAPGIAPLMAIAQRNEAAAAINGGFFNRNNQLPLGAIRIDGTWHSGPILNRGAIAWNDTGDILIDRVAHLESVKTEPGKTIPLTTLNSGYVRAGVARYTSAWGNTYTPLINNELVLTVQNSRITSHSLTGPAGQNPISIPQDGYLLVARAQQSFAIDLPVGASLQLQSITQPAAFEPFPYIVGGGPLLLKNRQVVLNAQAEQFSPAFITETAPRSAIGKTSEGTLVLATVHHRINGIEPSLRDVANIMLSLGCVDAINLDGGSSTSLYLGGQLVNHDRRATARVHNGIGVFLRPGS